MAKYVSEEEFKKALDKIEAFIEANSPKREDKKQMKAALEELKDRSSNLEWAETMYNDLLGEILSICKAVDLLQVNLNIIPYIETKKVEDKIETKYCVSFGSGENRSVVELSKEDFMSVTKINHLPRPGERSCKKPEKEEKKVKKNGRKRTNNKQSSN